MNLMIRPPTASKHLPTFTSIVGVRRRACTHSLHGRPSCECVASLRTQCQPTCIVSSTRRSAWARWAPGSNVVRGELTMANPERRPAWRSLAMLILSIKSTSGGLSGAWPTLRWPWSRTTPLQKSSRTASAQISGARVRCKLMKTGLMSSGSRSVRVPTPRIPAVMIPAARPCR